VWAGTPPTRRVLKWAGLATTTDYPPLALYELAVVGRIYWTFDPLYRDSPALTAAVKCRASSRKHSSSSCC
jgi:hypothetical protein